MATPVPSRPSRSKVQRVTIGVLLLLVASAGVLRFLLSDTGAPHSPAPREQVVTITLPPPPPVLPPPPPREDPPPPKDEPMVEQDPIVPEEETVDKPVETPPDDSQEVLGTNIQGNGPGLSGLGSSGNGGGRGIGTGKRSGKWDSYASSVQSTVTAALRGDSSTRSSAFSIQVRIWISPDGKITRASLTNSTGDPSLDTALRTRILPGLRLAQAPPADMPMPINLRIAARKPSS